MATAVTYTLGSFHLKTGLNQSAQQSTPAGYTAFAFGMDTSPWATTDSIVFQAFFSYDGGTTFQAGQQETLAGGMLHNSKGNYPGFSQGLPQSDVACIAYCTIDVPSAGSPSGATFVLD